MTSLLVAWLLTAPPSGSSPPPAGAKTLTSRMSPTAAGAVRVELEPSWGPRTAEEYSDPAAIEARFARALDEGPAAALVVTLDTRLSKEVGLAPVAAAKARGLMPELRFAGPTRTADGSMPEILQVNREIAQPPPLTRAELEAVLGAAHPKLRQCYEAELAKNALEGGLLLSLTLGRDGKVTAAELQRSALGRPEIERCLLEQLRALQFPPLRGAPRFVVSWPLEFQRGEKPPPRPGRDAGR